MDNIMMASAGQGGAGLRGDQYYPPPPPPPHFPLPFPSLHRRPTFPLCSPRSLLVPPVLHHHRRLHPTTVDLLSLLPTFLLRLLVLLSDRDVSRLTNRIAGPTRRDASLPSDSRVCMYVWVCVRARVCAWKQVLTYMRTLYTCVCNCGFERRLFITIGGTSDSLIASNDFSMLG